ncbi:MAG: DUF4270 family protein [Flavobacteriales bacterium]|nr:DUF4270 family protein [Flavobacteriales bacterium]
MKEKKLSLNQKKRFHICGAALFLCLVIVGCNKKEDKLGLGLYPEEEQLGLLHTDTFTINASTVKLDSVRSDDLKYSLLGSYVDPDFGQSTASFSAQFQPSKTTSVNFGDITTLVVDSVVLSLVHAGKYGIQGPHQFTVNELTEDIYKDSTYFSNSVFQKSTQNILSQSVYSPNYTGAGSTEQLNLKLDEAFGKKLLEQVNVSTDAAEFLDLFPGVNIASADVFTAAQPEGNGAIWFFDLANAQSKITVYYSNDTIASFDFVFASNLTKVNHFTHNYSGTSVETAINNPSTGESLLYMQGAAGAAINFEIPYLEGLVDNGPISINKAELVFTIEEGTADTYLAEGEYFLAVKTASGNYTFTIDEFDYDLTVGGTLNSENEYRFIINRDIQFLVNSYIKGEDYNFGYRLINGSGGFQSARTIFKGTKAGDGEMKLIVSYTPILK